MSQDRYIVSSRFYMFYTTHPSVAGLVAGGGVPLHVPSPSIGSLSNQRSHGAPRADGASVTRRTSEENR